MVGNRPDDPVGRVISPASKPEAGFDARECMAIARYARVDHPGPRRNDSICSPEPGVACADHLRRSLDRSWPWTRAGGRRGQRLLSAGLEDGDGK
jgi:hypothetical protein